MASWTKTSLSSFSAMANHGPKPKHVRVMDKASPHRSDRMKQMCSDAGGRPLYLPAYSPGLNPIDKTFR